MKLVFSEVTFRRAHSISFPGSFATFCDNQEVASIITRDMDYCLDKRGAKVGTHGQHGSFIINEWCVL